MIFIYYYYQQPYYWYPNYTPYRSYYCPKQLWAQQQTYFPNYNLPQMNSTAYPMVQSTEMNEWSGMNEMYQMSGEIHNNEEENNDPNEVEPKLQAKHKLPNFYQMLEELKEKVEKVEEENEELKGKLEDLQPINIENINYKIQELAVEDLSGTLNIGITALTDPENLKKLLKDFEGINVNDVEENEMEMEELEKLDNFEIQPKPPNPTPK